MTILQAVRSFRISNSYATKDQALSFADDEYEDSTDVDAFMAEWHKQQDAAAKVHAKQFAEEVERRWPASKGY